MFGAPGWLRNLVSRPVLESHDAIPAASDNVVEPAAVHVAPPLQLGQVFGGSSYANPLSYIVRDVERNFCRALKDDKYEVLVIYGTSKQGKSSLRRNVLPNDSCTFVTASQEVTREAIYREALNGVGASAKTTRESTSSVEKKFSIEINAPSWLMLDKLFGFGASAERERKNGVTTEEVEVDLSLAAAVARIYAKHGGRKPIVIDNFHHIDPDLQAQIATDIRAFAEYGIKFVMLGTWKAQNYIQKKNTDLIGRVCALSIEPWTDSDLSRVIDAGESLLNIKFSPNVRTGQLQRCTGNIALLHEIAQLYLLSLGISGRCENLTGISDEYSFRQACRSVADGVLQHQIEAFQEIAKIGEPWNDANKTRMYWILRAFLSDQRSTHLDGVDFARLYERIASLLTAEGHSETISKAVAMKLLKKDLISSQQKFLQTPIIGYDATADRLVTMDSWALFIIRLHRAKIVEALD